MTAERTLIGALLVDTDRLIDVAPMLTPDDFLDPIYADIYGAMLRLQEDRRGIDFVTVADALSGHTKLAQIGGSAFLATIAAEVPTSSHAESYAKMVKGRSVKRMLGRMGREISRLAETDERADALVERAEQQVLALSRTGSHSLPMHIYDVANENFERYAALYEAKDKAALFGLTTGFPGLDDLLTGLPPGHLMIVAARPSVGKSAFALDIARYVASHRAKNVAIFSLEMTKREIMDRVIAGFLGVETWKLKKGELTEDEFARMGKLFDKLKDHPIYLDDDSDTTLAHLRSKARRLAMEHGLDLLIVDYLQLIEAPDTATENRTQQVSYISRSLKNLARELQCPIIALSQLSRSCEQRSPPIPVLSDLRESGAIEQDADTVLMLYRADMYDPDGAESGLTDVYVRKNRNGPTGHVEIRFDGARMSFRESLPAEESAPRPASERPFPSTATAARSPGVRLAIAQPSPPLATERRAVGDQRSTSDAAWESRRTPLGEGQRVADLRPRLPA